MSVDSVDIELQKKKFDDIYFLYERGQYTKYGAFQEIDKIFNECKDKTKDFFEAYREIQYKLENGIPIELKRQIEVISKNTVKQEIENLKNQNNNILNPNNDNVCTRLLDLVFGYFPQFKKDFKNLLRLNVIEKQIRPDEYGDETLYLKWKWYKHTLTLYFGYMKIKTGSIHWVQVENLFRENKLGKDWSKEHKITAEYENLLKLLKKE